MCVVRNELEAKLYCKKNISHPLYRILINHILHQWGDYDCPFVLAGPPLLGRYSLSVPAPCNVKSNAGDCCKSFVSGNAGSQEARTSALVNDTLSLSLGPCLITSTYGVWYHILQRESIMGNFNQKSALLCHIILCLTENLKEYFSNNLRNSMVSRQLIH